MYVMSDGPYGKQDRDGDEIPEWVVTVFDDEDQEVDWWYCESYRAAFDFGEYLAEKRGLEHIAEGMEA